MDPKLLLDTHVWIWSHLDPERLAPSVRHQLNDPGTELWLSPISVWELLMLIEKQRLRVDAPARQWVEEALAAAPMRDAPFSREVALASRSLALTHSDPADHFIAATALTYELILVTADRRLLNVKNLPTLQADE